MSYRYLDIDSRFLPGIGFVRRPDSRAHEVSARYSPRPRMGWVRQFELGSSLDYVTNQVNELETRRRGLRFETEFESGDRVEIEFDNTFEFVPRPFEIEDDVVLPPGAYRFNAMRVGLDTFRRRHLRLNVDVETGGFWSGELDALQASVEYRMSAHVGLSGEYEVNWVDLPEGQFVTHLVSSRVQLLFRNNLALFSLLQYNDETREVSTNVRFNWIPKPGTDFFIVYNELDQRLGAFAPRNRSVTVKLNYLFAL
jgi:hypothetical protein